MTLDLIHSHPLETALPAGTGIRAVDHLEIVTFAAMALVLSADGEEIAVTAALAANEDLLVRFVSPGEWLVVTLSGTPASLLQDLSVLLGDSAYVSDQSDGRAMLRLSGPNVRRILAKGIGLDVHPSAFAVGTSANALCGHIVVNLARTQDNEFELIVMRSFARALFDDLLVMGREFDLSAGVSA